MTFIQTNQGECSNPQSSGNPGDWYEGLPPSYVDSAKSPIVFIHGLNSSSRMWWQENDMGDIVHENGFQTAFIDLFPTKDMWENGKLLAEKLKEIYNYFGEKLVLVGHSKGGIDAQTAPVHYNAASYVERIICLSSPHQGAELSDLAYSSWAGWLADIIGVKNAAVYSLQTGYMDYFRNQTDELSSIPIYTLAGTSWGSFGSSLYWGGLYLNSFGANDGAVTVPSSQLTYGTELHVDKWNHFEIRKGSATFTHFSDYLYETTPSIPSYSFHNEEIIYDNTADTFLRGGQYKGQAKEFFSVEDNVQELTINWLSNRRISNLMLTSPEAETWSDFVVSKDETTFFNGCWHHTLTLKKPSTGQWTLKAAASEENYLMAVQFNSPLNRVFNMEVGENLELVFPSVGKQAHLLDLKTIKNTIRLEYYDKETHISQETNWEDFGGYFSKKLPKMGEGVYNLTVDIEGKSLQNKRFNRTIVTSVYVDGNGKVIK
ncbi:triacylglycerol lipase [Halobacillus sp. Marseille-P3879]|uniref:esterase/lipase family protein n=1 Tax=Halobacillus sp. Marseille-P3879 TaxID=2045014 RepID=UPI00135701DA|nr:hypothetical protein [Halobacillus sp. Marseille-P3879]